MMSWFKKKSVNVSEDDVTKKNGLITFLYNPLNLTNLKLVSDGFLSKSPSEVRQMISWKYSSLLLSTKDDSSMLYECAMHFEYELLKAKIKTKDVETKFKNLSFESVVESIINKECYLAIYLYTEQMFLAKIVENSDEEKDFIMDITYLKILAESLGVLLFCLKHANNLSEDDHIKVQHLSKILFPMAQQLKGNIGTRKNFNFSSQLLMSCKDEANNLREKYCINF